MTATEGSPRVFLVNDTALGSAHFGCQLVCQAFREQFVRTGLRLVGSASKRITPDEVEAMRPHVDLFVVNGEGTVHHGHGGHLVALGARVPAVFVNAVYEANDGLPSLAPFRLVALRESRSAAYVQSLGVACETVPDAIFASAQLTGYGARLRTLRAMGRAEPAEGIAETDAVGGRKLRIGPFQLRLRDRRQQPFTATPATYLDFLARHRAVRAGRFHAACAAAVLGLPFTAWHSNSWKTQGLMADMGAAALCAPTEAEARALALPEAPLTSVEQYVAQAPGRIAALFDRIAAIARTEAAQRGN
jgi:hypothetical protein